MKLATCAKEGGEGAGQIDESKKVGNIKESESKGRHILSVLSRKGDDDSFPSFYPLSN